MALDLDIEQPAQLLHYLRSTGRIEPAEVPLMTPLKGGVSNRTVRVERPSGEAWVLKQALERLRVAVEWRCDPSRIHREALGLTWLRRLAPRGSIPALVFEDPACHLLAMEAVPQPHENWKTRLLRDGPETAQVRQFAQLLGTIHGRSQNGQVSAAFADRSIFESLRLEPYYLYTARGSPPAAGFLQALVEETRACRVALVHGDYSPKNVLLRGEQLVLLDHEVIHYGDPTFDLGFSMTHLLSKALHLLPCRSRFFEAVRLYWATYVESAPSLVSTAGFESRACRHTMGCLLARVDGRSPLEYLNPAEQHLQRQTVLDWLDHPPKTVPELIDRFARGLQRRHVHDHPPLRA